MRLTLRTLLAYLDDRLSPSNAREIGQKITASPFATELVERIREVKRKRRLAAPAKPQPMMDANLVAEYLDDQLTPELVARVELEILASDPMLAEVAASHEILGLIRDPVTVEPRLTDRLYHLDPTGRLDVVRAVGGQSQPSRTANSETPQWKPLGSRLSKSRRLPALFAALLALVWIMLVMSDSGLFGPGPVVVDEPGSKAAVGALAPGENLMVADAAQPGIGEDHISPVDTGNTNPAEVLPTEKAPADASAKSTLVDAGAEQPADAAAAPVPAGDVVASAKNEKMADNPASRDEKGKPADLKANAVTAAAGNNTVVAESAAYYLQADSRIVLAFDELQNRWIELSEIPGGEAVVSVPNMVNCGPLLGEKWFGVPQQFRAGVATDSEGWSALLMGPALVRVQDGTPAGLDLLSGRMRLSADPSIAWKDERPPTFTLGTGTQKSAITLHTPETRAAIEVVPVAVDAVPGRNPIEPTGSNLPLDADLQVQVTVLEGSIGLKSPGSNEQTLLTKGQRATWIIVAMQEFSSFTIDNGVPIAAAPAWLFETDAIEVPEQTILKNRLLDSLGTPNDPGDSVLPLLSDRNPQVGVLAVQVLSLTRDTDRLLSILFETLDESIHRAAIDGLAAIASSSHFGRDAIRKGLETRLPMAEIDATAQLIEGITSAQASDPRVTADLMALLSNDRLSTRTLAIYRMEQFTKDRMGYHPEAEASRRREAIRRWQKYLDRNSGRLVAEPPEAID